MNTIARQLLASLLVTVLLVIGSGGYVELRRVVADTEVHLRDTQSAIATRLSQALTNPCGIWTRTRPRASFATRRRSMQFRPLW